MSNVRGRKFSLICCFHLLWKNKYLIVDESPLFEKAVDAHDGANVASEIAAACRARQIFRRVQAVSVDHEVPIPLNMMYI